ncbi:membrane protein [Campylobacter mucosalis]|uniref:sulfite exporter TauE/SafE family protein n=1 Tax=Campylobacter mucosalis TaxID=202 RepID=UPI0004D6FCB7|nr:sulfite exporter TauE/SafE family protein [Campylobacter mucosalis]KEA45946.1 membrane protein [Campylobacter mucosalis]QKF63642.1 sulfite exporter TauE/SafE family protein [Campylobacter mucosalis]
MDTLPLLGVFGVAAGFIAGFFGVGGGTVIVPLLLAVGYDVKMAIGISIMQMLFSSAFGSYFNYKAGLLKVGNALFIGLGGLFGASFSGYIVKITPDIVLKSILLGIFIFSLLKLFFSPSEKDGKEKGTKALLFLIGTCVGMLAISVGVGGAVFITPILVGFLGYKLKDAVGIGLFFVIFSSLSGFISFAFNGQIDYFSGIAVGVSSILGVYYGTKTSHKTDKVLLRRCFLVFYLLMISIMIYKIFIN